MKVGFIGLGNMGSAMARNLIKAGHTLSVYNRTRSRTEPFASLGARIVETPGEAAADAEVLITMLADDAAVEGVIFARGNTIQALSPGAVHISMSTISVRLSRRLAEAHRERKQPYIAAAVFGRPDVAAAGKLWVVAGGSSESVESCQLLFDAIGQRTFLAGEEAHTANAIKLAGNFVITTVIESLAEAFAFIRKSGVDPTLLSGHSHELALSSTGVPNLRQPDRIGSVRACRLQVAARIQRQPPAAGCGGRGRGADADGEPGPRSVCSRSRSRAGRIRLGRDRAHVVPGRRTAASKVPTTNPAFAAERGEMSIDMWPRRTLLLQRSEGALKLTNVSS